MANDSYGSYSYMEDPFKRVREISKRLREEELALRRDLGNGMQVDSSAVDMLRHALADETLKAAEYEKYAAQNEAKEERVVLSDDERSAAGRGVASFRKYDFDPFGVQEKMDKDVETVNARNKSLQAAAQSLNDTAREVAYLQAYLQQNRSALDSATISALETAIQSRTNYLSDRQKRFESSEKAVQSMIDVYNQNASNVSEDNQNLAQFYEDAAAKQNAGKVAGYEKLIDEIDAYNERGIGTDILNAVADPYGFLYGGVDMSNRHAGVDVPSAAENKVLFSRAVDARVAREKAKAESTGGGMIFADLDSTYGKYGYHRLYSYMTELEVATYTNMLEKEGKEAADQWLQELMPTLNNRELDPYYQHAASSGLNATIDSIASVGSSVLGSLPAFVDDAMEWMSTGEIDPYSEKNKMVNIANAWRAGTASRTDNEILKGVYYGAMSLVDTAASIAVGNAIGSAFGATSQVGSALTNAANSAKTVTKVASTGLMASRVATSTIRDAKARGLSDNQAMGLALLSAAIEVVTEKFSIEAFLGDPTSAISYIAKNIVTEGAEELTSSVLNTVVDTIVAGDKSYWQQAIAAYKEKTPGASQGQAFANVLWEHMGQWSWDGLAGMAGGLVFGGFGAAKYAYQKAKLKRATAKPGDVPIVESTTDSDASFADDVFAEYDVFGNKRQSSEVVENVGEDDISQTYGTDESPFAEAFEEVVANTPNDQNRSSVKEQLIENSDRLNSMEPVASYENHTYAFQSQQQTKAFVVDLLAETGYLVHREGFGDVVLDSKRINKGISYLKTREEILAFAAVPHVIEKGVVISNHQNHKGRKYSTITFAAPVVINAQRGNLAVVVRQENRNYYKVHRIVMPDGAAFFLENEGDIAEPAGQVVNNADLSPTVNVSTNSIPENAPVVNQNLSTPDSNTSFIDDVFADTDAKDDTNTDFYYTDGENIDPADSDTAAPTDTLPDTVEELEVAIDAMETQGAPQNELLEAYRKLNALHKAGGEPVGSKETSFTRKYKDRAEDIQSADVPTELLRAELENGGARYDPRSDASLEAEADKRLGSMTEEELDAEFERLKNVEVPSDLDAVLAKRLINLFGSDASNEEGLYKAAELKRAFDVQSTESGRALRQRNLHVNTYDPVEALDLTARTMDMAVDDQLGDYIEIALGGRKIKKSGSELLYSYAERLRRAVSKHGDITDSEKAAVMRSVLLKSEERIQSGINHGSAGGRLKKLIDKAVKKKSNGTLIDLFDTLYGAETSVESRYAVAKALDLTYADAETLMAVADKFQQIRDLGDGEDAETMKKRVKQLEDAYRVLAKRLPVTWMEKFDKLRQTAMLSAPKTYARNSTANAAGFAMRKADDVASSIAEGIYYKVHGKSLGTTRKESGTKKIGWRLTKHGRRIADTIKQEAAREMQLLELEGVNKYDTSTGTGVVKQYREIFKSPAMKAIVGTVSDIESFLLKIGDDPFYKEAYGTALGQIATRREADAITDEMRNIARATALEATFKAENKMIETVQKWRRSGVIPKMIIDSNLAFVTTPLNILSEGFQHTPANLFVAAYQLEHDARNGADSETIAKHIRSMGKAMSGTTISAVAYALARAGVIEIVGKLGVKEDDRSEAELTGKREYSIRIGDRYISLDWAQPAVAPLFFGAACAESIEKQYRDGVGAGLLNTADFIWETLTGGYGSLFDTSTLSSLDNFFKSGDINSAGDALTDFLLSSFTKLPQQFVPAALRSAIGAFDNKKRSYVNASWAQKTAANLGFTSALPEERDIWGNPVYQNAGKNKPGLAALIKLISPSNVTDGVASEDELSKTLVDLYNNADSALAGNAIPTGIKRNWRFYEGGEIVLDSDRRTELEEALGKAYRTSAEDFIKNGHPVAITDPDGENGETVQVQWDTATEEQRLLGLQKVFARTLDSFKRKYGIVTDESADPPLTYGVEGVPDDVYETFLRDTTDFVKTDSASVNDQKWEYISGMETDDQTKANLWGSVNLNKGDREKYTELGLSSDQYCWYNYFADQIEKKYDEQMDAAKEKGYKRARYEREASKEKQLSLIEMLNDMDLTSEQKWQLYKKFGYGFNSDTPVRYMDWWDPSDKREEWFDDIWED